MRKLLIVLMVLIVMVVGFYAIQMQSPTLKSDRFQVVGSFYPMAYFASHIVGNVADVINITPPGIEPHDYDLSTSDVVALERARLIVLNGVVEAWGERIRANFTSHPNKVVTVGDGLFTRVLPGGQDGVLDSHVWLSPVLAKVEARKIFETLIQLDPEHSTLYQSNEQALEKKMDQLDAAYKDGLRLCTTKDIVTSHAAFGYLAQTYGLNQISVAGLSPDEEPSAQQLASVVAFVRDHGVKYIFFESLVSPKLAQTIANETGAKTLELNPLEGLSEADLQQGKDYFSVMLSNLHNLQIALECQK